MRLGIIKAIVFTFWMAIFLTACGKSESQIPTSGENTVQKEENAAAAPDPYSDQIEKLDAEALEVSDIQTIAALTAASVAGNGKIYECTDAENLARLEELFSNSTRCHGGSGCPFDECTLYLTTKEGKIYRLHPASDGCNVILSNGDSYYYYGSASSGFENSKVFWNAFGIEDSHKVFGKNQQ